MDVFGPVRSRRLGNSLGVNHLPPKTCTYSCVYCQLGRTSFMTTNRARFSDPEAIHNKIADRLAELKKENVSVDTIAFVSNGEPTLDRSLGEMLQKAKTFGIQTAVITNASLLWHPDTARQLMHADVVSLKVDTVIEETWHKLDRPHGTLKLDTVFNGMHRFAQFYKGKLITETLLVDGVNDSEKEAKANAVFIADLNPDTAYIALPLRPPAEAWVKPSRPENLTRVYQIFKDHITHVEILMDLPETEFLSRDDLTENLLRTLRVHPLTREEVETHLKEGGESSAVIETLLAEKEIQSFHFRGSEFLVSSYKAAEANA